MDARYFKLDGNELSYWERQADCASKPKGKFIIGPGATVKHVTDPPNSFALTTGGEQLVLQADDDGAKNEWVSKLNKLICNVSTNSSKNSAAQRRKKRRDEMKDKYGIK